MKITAGYKQLATVNSARTIFSPSPIHFDVSDDALMLKNVAFMLLATAFPIRVFPVPGGPKSKTPLGGARAPLKNSGFYIGHTMISMINFFM